ncbi:MAG: sn-glycerol-3-phosphate ABC transporter ATP-binding protein UgpC [Nitrospiraceae bacterium]|nr:MAG: sn-glycerol-3-phosphate ABC transporter ATP-binding protein UgpC [Nitrospiraceae bacterium]
MGSLKVSNLKKSFGNTEVIRDVSFEIHHGEFCVLLGPSGCGKTTVLRLIAGLDQSDQGSIFINDRDVSNLTPRDRDIAMVFQSYALYPHMSVFDNMAFALKMRNMPKNDIDLKVKETASLLELYNFLDRKPKELSGGQRQRVAIGRAIVRNPKLFLFDEPLSNLDAKLRSTMRVELANLHQKLKVTTVYVTHDQVEAMTLGEKIILFDQGEIQQTGTPDEVYHKPSNLFVATFIGTPQINLFTGTTLHRDGKIFFESGPLMIDVSSRTELMQYTGKDLIMGIRPESLSPGAGPITGTVELTEHLGPETLIYVSVNGKRITAKAASGFQIRRGAEITLSLADTGVHFFLNGKRITE